MSMLYKLNSEQLAESVLKGRKKESKVVPSYVAKEFDIDELVVSDRSCYRLKPKTDFNGTYIFYVYGGQMCHGIKDEQWQFITKLAKDTGTGVYVPLYPLAPESCCRELFEMMLKTYGDFAKSIDVEKIVLLGDSSGAGIALSLAILAWQEGLRKPDQLILLSPILDTEFFDLDIEQELLSKSIARENIFYNEAAKEFINNYWVKDCAVKTHYTSPFYEDYTDICDDIVLFSSIDELFSCYDRDFYKKAKQQNVNIRFFEFVNEQHDFMIFSNSNEQKKAYGYLKDVINGTYDTAMRHIYMVKKMANWSKKYPELVKSDSASRFIYDKQFDFSKVEVRTTEYREVVLASSYSACDEKIRRYIMEFPNCTVIQVGCLLDDMFSRHDNGRIQWYSVGSHNNIAVRRALYGVRDREITIGRNIMDFSWIDDIKCERKKGVIFVFNDSLANMTASHVKQLFERLMGKFSGAEIVFTTTTGPTRVWTNLRKKLMVNAKKRRFAVNDAYKLFGGWNTEYRIISEEPVMKVIRDKQDLKLITRLGIFYNNISYNHKIIHFRLGGEVYEIKVEY
jgi:acetyl esterase/lipase